MRKSTLFFIALLGVVAAKAQTVATFETLTLPKADTFYMNFTNPGTDQGFDDGLAHFESYYDQTWGDYWSSGFSYSNMTDNVTPDYTNDHSSITGDGNGGSAQYNVYYGDSAVVRLKGKAIGQPVSGFYVANTTFAYYSMLNGDFVAKKFGGAMGTDSDWFSIKVYGYKNNVRTTDSVEFFLADFRTPGAVAADTIYEGWRWVNLLPLGEVDSLIFYPSSSDVGAFGINTPKYFCMDDFTTYETASVADVKEFIAKVFPNPVVNELNIELPAEKTYQINILDATGKVMMQQATTGRSTKLNTANFAPGTYMLQLTDGTNKATQRFVKQ